MTLEQLNKSKSLKPLLATSTKVGSRLSKEENGEGEQLHHPFPVDETVSLAHFLYIVIILITLEG